MPERRWIIHPILCAALRSERYLFSNDESTSYWSVHHVLPWLLLLTAFKWATVRKTLTQVSLITLFTVQITTSNSGFKDKAKTEKENGLKSKQLGFRQVGLSFYRNKNDPATFKNVPSFRKEFLLARNSARKRCYRWSCPDKESCDLFVNKKSVFVVDIGCQMSFLYFSKIV